MKKEATLENMGWLEASLLLKSYHPITMYEWPWLEPFNCFKVFVAYVSYVGLSRVSKNFEFHEITAD